MRNTGHQRAQRSQFFLTDQLGLCRAQGFEGPVQDLVLLFQLNLGIVNIFVGSSAVSWIISGIGVIVFTGLTAYDTSKIKEMAAMGVDGRKPAILGALTLYLDFINLFLMLLRFTGNRR